MVRFSRHKSSPPRLLSSTGTLSTPLSGGRKARKRTVPMVALKISLRPRSQKQNRDVVATKEDEVVVHYAVSRRSAGGISTPLRLHHGPTPCVALRLIPMSLFSLCASQQLNFFLIRGSQKWVRYLIVFLLKRKTCSIKVSAVVIYQLSLTFKIAIIHGKKTQLD